MSVVSMQEAQARLPELIADLQHGEAIQITSDGKPVARLTPEASASRRPRQPGSAIGKLIVNAEDDEHLRDFGGYM